VARKPVVHGLFRPAPWEAAQSKTACGIAKWDKPAIFDAAIDTACFPEGKDLITCKRCRACLALGELKT